MEENQENKIEMKGEQEQISTPVNKTRGKKKKDEC